MAVTSSGASEMVAISSLFTFDVYRRYIDPKVSWACLFISPSLVQLPALLGAVIALALRGMHSLVLSTSLIGQEHRQGAWC